MRRASVCASALIALLLIGCTQDKQSLVLGRGVGTPPEVADAMLQILQQNNIDARLFERAFESADELSAEVEGGAVDIALLGEPLAHNSKLRMLMPVLPRVLHVLHHKSMGTPTLKEILSSPSIFPGQPNSLGRTIITELAAHHQINDIESRLLDAPWVPAPGKPPQVYFILGGLLSPDARQGFVDYRFFSFDEASDSSPEALVLLYPNLRPFALPAGIYPNLSSSAIQTVAVETLLVSRPEFDEDLAYQVVQAMQEQAQPVEEAYPLSRATITAPMGDTHHTLAMHSGARNFIDKDTPSLLERYAEVFALMATVALGLGTLFAAWLRQRRQRRKDRLDEYFLHLHSLRARAREGGDEKSTASAEVTALEAKVLELLVEERLEVDAALVSFFIMSESVRRECDAEHNRPQRSRG